MMDLVLTPELEQLIAERIESGQYGSPSEVIHTALVVLKQRDDDYQQRLEELRGEIAIGVEQADRGEVAPLDMAAIKAEARRRVDAKKHVR